MHRRPVARFVVLVGMALALDVVGPSAVARVGASHPSAGSVDSPTDAGDVTVVDERGNALSAGGSADLFTLRLPREAACPGDSAFDQWRVQTFLVPASEDPSGLQYAVIGPDGENQHSLRNPNTSPYIHRLTRANSGPGSPGAIDPLPYFSLEVFSPDQLPSGRYRMGVACTYFRETATYWDVRIDVAVNPTDTPGAFRWTVLDAPDGAVIAGESPGGLDMAALGLAAIFVLVVVVRVSRRRARVRAHESADDRRHPSPVSTSIDTKEPS